MKAQLLYGRYVFLHKLYVLLEGMKLGVPIVSLILHDWDKMLPDEWFPYVASFYGPKYPKILEIHGDQRNRVLDNGHYKEKVREAFDVAWLLHQHRNRHHWQFWCLLEDDGGVKCLEMPDRHRREMLADWMGAGRAQGKPDTQAWYIKNQFKMQLHPETRAWVEKQLGVDAPVNDINASANAHREWHLRHGLNR